MDKDKKRLRELADLPVEEQASTPAIVAFDLSDVFSEVRNDRQRLKGIVQNSMASLSSKEKQTVANWVASLVDMALPKKD